MYVHTVNILKIHEIFVHFKSYLLKFRGNMNFFAVFLQKLEPSCEIGAYSAAIFRKVLYRKWPPLALSLSPYPVYLGISRLQRGAEPQYWRSVRVLRRGEEFP